MNPSFMKYASDFLCVDLSVQKISTIAFNLSTIQYGENVPLFVIMKGRRKILHVIIPLDSKDLHNRLFKFNFP